MKKPSTCLSVSISASRFESLSAARSAHRNREPCKARCSGSRSSRRPCHAFRMTDPWLMLANIAGQKCGCRYQRQQVALQFAGRAKYSHAAHQLWVKPTLSRCGGAINNSASGACGHHLQPTVPPALAVAHHFLGFAIIPIPKQHQRGSSIAKGNPTTLSTSKCLSICLTSSA
jgi:hypothetical protein